MQKIQEGFDAPVPLHKKEIATLRYASFAMTCKFADKHWNCHREKR